VVPEEEGATCGMKSGGKSPFMTITGERLHRLNTQQLIIRKRKKRK